MKILVAMIRETEGYAPSLEEVGRYPNKEETSGKGA